MVLGAAVAGKVQYIVTGDKDLPSIGEFQDIKILDPRAYWNEMKNTARR
jgi:predicted nucleic acid-binding protein